MRESKRLRESDSKERQLSLSMRKELLKKDKRERLDSRLRDRKLLNSKRRERKNLNSTDWKEKRRWKKLDSLRNMLESKWKSESKLSVLKERKELKKSNLSKKKRGSSMRLKLRLREEIGKLRLKPIDSSKKRELKSTDYSRRPEEPKLSNKWNSKDSKEKKGRRKLAKSISEFKLRDKSNMSNLLLREMQESRPNAKSKRKRDSRLRLELQPRKLKEKDKLKSTAWKWKRKPRLGELSKRDSDLSMNRELKLSVLRERRDSKSIDLSKKSENKKDKLKLKPTD